MSVPLTLYRAAIASSVSLAVTLTMRPVTGGMRRTLPARMSFIDFRLLAHTIDMVETSYLAAIAVSVSLPLTV